LVSRSLRNESDGRPGGLRTAVLVVISATLLPIAWLELERDASGFGALFEIIGLAVAPALALLLLGRGRTGIIAAAVLVPLSLLTAASVAYEVPLTDMRPFSDRAFFGPVFGAMGEGFRDMYDTDTPFDPNEHLELVGLVLLGIFAFLGAAALALALGRPLVGGSILLVGIGFPTTIAAAAEASQPLRTGALVLGALLLFLFLSRPETRPLRGATAATGFGLAVVLVAVGLSTSSAVAKTAFVPWERWDFYDKPTDPVAVRYVWASNYTGIKFPDKETIVLKIKAPDRELYWRATTLDEFTGAVWREELDLQPAEISETGEIVDAPDDPTLPRLGLDEEQWTQQEVTVVALADNHLIAASHPVRWQTDPGIGLQYAQGGVVVEPDGLQQDQKYTVWSFAPEVKPAELAALPPRYPESLGRFLEVGGVRFPEFGVANRNRLVERRFDGGASVLLEPSDDPEPSRRGLAQYEPLYRQAQELVAGATSPYVVAASLETWFRTGGGFTYSEQPAQPLDTTPPLVDFTLRTKEGYCQQFAGSMAVMLRLLGIPARVAAGFTSGRYDSRRGEWVVTDYNAHTWVEVYFPRYGWLPFDPTPGRGQLGAAYSTASEDFPTGGVAALGIAPEALSAILLQRLRGIEGLGGGPQEAGTLPGAGGRASTDETGIGVPALVFIVIGGAVAVLLSIKALRARARFVGHDPRRTAGACRRDLVAFLVDQGFSFPSSATIAEVGELVERVYRVNTTPFVRAANAARFGTPETAADAARRARRELRTLRAQLRKELSTLSRVLGAFRLRSLAV
jgi:transglutaminase-like putative cysteine protease